MLDDSMHRKEDWMRQMQTVEHDLIIAKEQFQNNVTSAEMEWEQLKQQKTEEINFITNQAIQKQKTFEAEHR